MLVAVDIGNTNIVLGFLDGDAIAGTYRITTKANHTSDEYGLFLTEFLRMSGFQPSDVDDVIICSVVPKVMHSFRSSIVKFLDIDPMVVGPGIKTGMNVRVDDPKSLGADILADCAGAYYEYGGPVLVADFGTATTFNVIDENKVFRGGVICPGLSTGLRALGERCAQLPQVHLSSPKSAIGVDTEKCMLSGSVLGTAVLLDGITQRIEEELGRPATLVVTGGLAKYVIPLCRHPLTYDPELLLKGLALLYQLNAPQHERHHEPRSDGERRRPRPTGRRPYNNGSSPRRRSHNNRRPRRDDEAKAG